MTNYDPADFNRDHEVTDEERAQYVELVKTAAKYGIPLSTLLPSDTPNNSTTTSSSTENANSTSSDVTIYSLNQVRNIATNAFENTLGRAPTADELNTFVSSLNAFSKANPTKVTKNVSGTSKSKNVTETNATKTKTTSTSTPVDSSTPTSTTTSSSTTSGGVDVSGFLQGQLENTTEARAVKVDDIFRGAMSFLADKIGG